MSLFSSVSLAVILAGCSLNLFAAEGELERTFAVDGQVALTVMTRSGDIVIVRDEDDAVSIEAMFVLPLAGGASRRR